MNEIDKMFAILNKNLEYVITAVESDFKKLNKRIATLEAELKQFKTIKLYEVQTKTQDYKIGDTSIFYIKTNSQEAADKLAKEIADKNNAYVLSVIDITPDVKTISVTETLSKESSQ